MGLLLGVLGTVASYVQLTRFLREDLTHVVSAQQMALAEYVARDVDDYLRDRQRFLERLAATLPDALLAQPARLAEWLAERRDLQPSMSLGLAVADTSGKVLVELPPASGAPGALMGGGGTLAGRPDFLAARGGLPVIGRPRIDPVSLQPILPMALPIRDASGRVAAVLLGTPQIATDGFLARMLQGHIGRSGGVLLISPQDQLFVASSDPAMVLQATPAAGVNPLHDRAMAGYRGSGTTINAKGIEEISAIASVPSAGWFVVARLPTAEALATVGRMQDFILRYRSLGVGAGLVLISLVVAWLFRPLLRAAAQAEKMARGELPLTPLPVVRDDEIGQLTTAFNRLLSRLDDHQAELGRLAHHDSLTGLPNRKLLADRLHQALARAQRQQSQVALLFLDLDGFKQLNDTLGHEAGDTALKEVALRLSGVVRQSDTVARLGGDEFVLLATDINAPVEHSLHALAQKCIAAVGRPLRLGERDHVLGVSVGIALSDGSDSAEHLLVAADKAMYGVKQGGRGGYAVAPARAGVAAPAPSPAKACVPA